MANYVWFVPGFMGSTLGLYPADGGRRVGSRIASLWGTADSLLNLPVVDLLRLPSTLPPDQGIFADGIVDLAGQGYGSFMTFMRQNLGSSYTLIGWPFDFRKSARDVGDELAVALAGSAALGNTNYVLAHSQGALIAWCAWSRLVDDGTTAACRKLVTFGGALYGTQSTPNFFREEEDSLALLARLRLIMAATGGWQSINAPYIIPIIALQSGNYVNDAQIGALIGMAGTWPGIYSLYPDAARLDDPDDTERPLLFLPPAWAASLSPPNFALMATEVARVHTWLRTPAHVLPYDRVAHIVGEGILTPTTVRPSSLTTNPQGTFAQIVRAGSHSKTARLLQLPQFLMAGNGDGRCTAAQQRLPNRYFQTMAIAHTEMQNSRNLCTLAIVMLTSDNPPVATPNPVSVVSIEPLVFPPAPTGLPAAAFLFDPRDATPAPRPLPGSGIAAAPLILGGDP